MIYTIFEDNNAENFFPFTINHSVVEIRFGAFSILSRLEKRLSNTDEIILVVRDGLKEIVAERYPHIRVNPDIIPASNLYRTSTLDSTNLDMGKSTISEDISLIDFIETMSKNQDNKHLWDYLELNDLEYDKEYFAMTIDGECHSSCIFINKDNIHLSESSKILAGVILDATNGPIIIDDDVMVDIGALIKGPAYIGKGSTINPGSKIRGNVSIGPYCKVGGEVEDVTFHGYSNKQHDGYLGHSYVGEWVNIGANTNNSDLKNNYSNIKFQIGKDVIDTKQMFLGCLIGDYTKTGISTMINTGTYIGVGCNIFGGGFQKKCIPSFSWGKDSRVDLNKFLSTLDIVKGRRAQNLSKIEKIIITKIYNSLNNSNF